MAEYIVMPKLGFDMREGVLNTWLKSVGENVTKGEVVAEIESDKATLELEAQVGGVLLHVLHEPGDIVPVGANMAIVGEQGEDVSGLIETAGEPADEAEPEPAAQKGASATPSGAAAEESYPAQATAPAAGGQPDVAFPNGVKATPVARRVASEQNVNLLQVRGTGPDGRIRKADVEAYLRSPQTAAPAVAAPAAPDSTEVKTTRLRQAIARRMTESKTTVPHFYVTSEIDMGEALALRKKINAQLPEDEKVSVNDMIVKAAALALRDFPNLNASFGGDVLIQHNRINIGSAVAVEGGLLTVAQKDTDITPLRQVAADNREMISRAREGKVRPDDIEGSTFTVSNLGGFDVDHFIAIINPPDAAILAIGSAREVPIVVEGQLAVGTRMKVTISADHRVTDGAEAARYLQTFKAVMEAPLRLLL